MWQILKLIAGFGGKLTGIIEMAAKFANFIWNSSKGWLTIDENAHKAARSIGLSKEQAEGFRKTVIQSQIELGALYNLTAEEMFDAQEKYSDRTGKALQLNREQMEMFAMTSKSVGKDALNDLVGSIDELGGSYELANAYAITAYNNAKKFGLNAQKSSANFAKNFKAVNKLRFREGISDLMKMTMLSDKFKVNFDEVAKSIDNFDTIEDAISNASKIQMLGGNMAYQFGNPLAAMADAQTDAAGFMDRIVESVKGMATWDASAGVAKIDKWVDQTKVKELAKSLGMSAEELTKIATQSVKFGEVEKSIGTANKDRLAQAGLLDAVENLARMKDGKWVVQDATGQDRDLNDVLTLDNNQLKEFFSSVATDDIDTNVKDISQNVKAIAKHFGASQSELFSFKEHASGLTEGVNGSLNVLSEQIMGPASNIVSDAAKQYSTNPHGAFGLVDDAWDSIVPDIISDWVGKPSSWLESLLDKSTVEGVIPGMNSGGIIGGHQEQGDNILAGVNSKEMVLTQGQQKNLYDQIQSNPNLPKFNDGGIVGSQEQQDLFKYANMQHHKNANREENQGKLIKNIGFYTIYKGINNARKAEEVAQYGQNIIRERVLNSNGSAKWVTHDGFKNKREYEKALKQTRRNVLRGNSSSMAIGTKTNRIQRSVNVTPETLAEKFDKVLGKFNKQQRELVNDFKRTSKTYQSATEKLTKIKNLKHRANARILGSKPVRTVTSTLNSIKRLDLTKPFVSVGRTIAKPFVAVGKYIAKPFQALSKSSVGTLAKGTFKNVGQLASKSNPINVGKSVLGSAKGAVSTVTSKVSNSAIGKTVSKIGGKLGGKALGKVLKRVPVIGSLITAGGVALEAMGASDKFNAEKDWINSRTDLTEKDKKKMIRESEDKRNETYGKAAGGAIGMAIGGALGSVLGPVGTIVGGVAGEWVGNKAGGFIGKHWNNAKDFLFGSKQEEEITNNENNQETNNETHETNSYNMNNQTSTLLYEKANDIYKLLVKNFGNEASNNIYHSNYDDSIHSQYLRAISSDSTITNNTNNHYLSSKYTTNGISANYLSQNNDKTYISSVPVVGNRTYINPVNDYQNNNSTVNGNINLNINGTLKLDVPTTNQSINIDLESIIKTREFQDKILDIIRNEMSSFGGLRNREHPSYRGCGGTSYMTNYL